MLPEMTSPVEPVTNVTYYRPEDPGEAAEYDAFVAMLPQLRVTNAGEYVAVSGGRVVARGPDLGSVLTRAKEARTEPFFCGWVEPPGGTVIRFPSPTNVQEIEPR
jgi:hypothetical protein